MNAKVLVVEDDRNMGFLIKENLRLAGFKPELSPDGKHALNCSRHTDYDLYLLDIMMPEKDGFDLAKKIREEDRETPIVFLTAKSLPEDKIKGFELGCDDFICKPFNVEELLWRLKAILRRTTTNDADKELIQLGPIEIYPGERLLILNGERQQLSAKEAQLLHIFCVSEGQVVTRKQLLESVWERDDFFTSKSLDIYIHRLRKLLNQEKSISLLNVYGLGYKLVCAID